MERIALVTGAASGIGLATARLLLKEGYTVVGISRRTKMEDLGKGFYYLSGDVGTGRDRERIISFVRTLFGRLDVLVNVAGVAPKERNDLLSMTEESYDYVTNINTRGTLFLTQLVARLMLENEGERKGAIVNVSSCSAYTSSVNRGEYCISKAGVSMITKLFADRLAGEGITVNEVCPGIIATDMTAGVRQKYDTLIEDGLVPMRRWGRSEDVASAICALADGTLPYMTGQSVAVDGGMHIRRL